MVNQTRGRDEFRRLSTGKTQSDLPTGRALELE